MPSSSFVEPSTDSSKPAYDAKMFESADINEMDLSNVRNVAGPDRSELLKMLRERIITVQEFKELDRDMLNNARMNMSGANAEMFKNMKGNKMKGNNIYNGHHEEDKSK